MNYQAENRVTLTKELFYEGMLRMSRDSYLRFAGKCVLLFAAVWAVLVYLTLKNGGSLISIFTCLMVVVLLSFWICVRIPRSHAKKAWKAQQRLYGDSMERITRFYDTHLEISGDCAQRTVAYRDIREVRESRNLILLICFDKMGILLSREGFTKGSYEAVVELIRNAPR